MNEKEHNAALTQWNYRMLKLTLNRVPIFREFKREYPVAANDILCGKYDEKIRTWNQFLVERGEKLQKRRPWTKERIAKKFYKVKESLGKTPSLKEFRRKAPQALEAIKNGLYSPSVIQYSEFLEDLKEKGRVYWNADKIEESFYALKERLKRTPTSSEFKDVYRGAHSAINNKKYAPSISTWNEFLNHLGEEIKPTPNSIGLLEALLEEDIP